MSAELSSGQRIGPYRLLFRLGKGGMGEVWAAQKAASHGFERLVALKLLRGVTADSNAAVMFFDEARAAAALQHAAIVPTTDLGQYGDTFYIAMGMVRGPSLTALLQRLAVQKRPVAPAIVSYIGERLASALDYAYERAEIDGRKLRLVHRDISPHNVLIDEEGNVLLSDFGVARTAVQDHESRVGTVRGKPSYMAPEQVRGGAMDARTDLFALGICLYEASCVKRLFGRSNPVKSMDAVVNYQPKPLPSLVPDFPEGLWRAIERALAKAPEERFQTSAEFGRALADVNKTLPGASTAARDLAALIAEVFPAGSFNVDARVAEALQQQQALDEVQEATRFEQRKSLEAAGSPFVEPAGTGAWPTAYHGNEPLDPDVLAAVGADMTANAPPQMFAATNSGSMPSFQQQSYPQVTGTSNSGNRASTVAIFAISLAALMAAGAAYWVSNNTRPMEVAETDPAPAPTATPGIEAAAPAPGAVAGVTAQPKAPPVEPAARPRAPAATPVRTKVAETPRPPPRDEPPASAAPKPAKEPVTRESVMSLINSIGDRTRAGHLRAMLAEAGNDDVMLSKVRDQALEAVAQKPN